MQTEVSFKVGKMSYHPAA